MPPNYRIEEIAAEHTDSEHQHVTVQSIYLYEGGGQILCLLGQIFGFVSFKGCLPKYSYLDAVFISNVPTEIDIHALLIYKT